MAHIGSWRLGRRRLPDLWGLFRTELRILHGSILLFKVSRNLKGSKVVPFLVMTYVLFRDYHIESKKELRLSLWVATSVFLCFFVQSYHDLSWRFDVVASGPS